MASLRPLALRIGRIPWLPRYLPVIVRVDRVVGWLSLGRLGLLTIAGLPNIVLTVPGRKTGRPLSTPLLCWARPPRFLVAGSNFGQAKEPQWVKNLAAAGRGLLRHRGRSSIFRSRELQGSERDRAWAELVALWPNFELYERRTDRRIRVFELTAQPSHRSDSA